LINVALPELEHGLNFPEFDPNEYFASDLFRDSSPLSRIAKEDADVLCQSIEEKRQTLRIAQANLALNQDVIRTGIDFQKLVGSVIDYGTTKINNRTRFVNFETAGVNLTVAEMKKQQAHERLAQEQIILDGMTELTPLIREEWQERKALKLSRIYDLRQQVYEANAKLDEAIQQLITSNV
jgi:hypothetical protein